MKLIDDLFNQALGFHRKGNINFAAPLYETILSHDKDHHQALHFLGIIKFQAGQTLESVKMMERAIELETHSPLYYSNIADPYISLKEYDKAEKVARKAIKLNKKHIDAYIQLGRVLREKKQYGASVASFKKALDLNPDDKRAYNNLGNTYRLMGVEEKAKECFEKALAIDPNHIHALSNMGLQYYDSGEPKKAIPLLQKAIEINNDHVASHVHLAMCHLVLKNYTQGWEHYSWRHKLVGLAKERQIKTWNGLNFKGTLLVFSEQGFGDTIQFMRYIPLLKNKVSKVILSVQKPLLDLLKGIQKDLGCDEIISSDDLKATQFDQQISLLEIPRILNTQYSEIPKEQIIKTKGLKSKINYKKTKPVIGLAWQGNALHRNDRYRSIPFQKIKSILGRKDCEFISLHKEYVHKEKLPKSLKDFSKEIHDFCDTAVLVDQCDLVVTVDTSIAHLSGTMNKPTIVLLPKGPDWRWGLEESETKWYKSMTLLRQKELGNWDIVIDDLEKSIEQALSAS